MLCFKCPFYSDPGSIGGSKLTTRKCLKIEQFQTWTAADRANMRNNEFCDVTLVSNDNQRIRVILASASIFLRTMLVNEIHPHPLIFIRGVEYHVLEGFIDFIYSDETKLEQKHVNLFQKLCMEMELFGIKKRDCRKRNVKEKIRSYRRK